MIKQFSMELAGRTLMVEIGKVAAQLKGLESLAQGDDGIAVGIVQRVVEVDE